MIESSRRLHARFLASVVIAATLAVLTAVPAAADAPTVVEQHFVRQIPNRCPDFATLATFYVDRTVTTFYDAAGHPIRQKIAGVFPGTIMNVESGYTLSVFNVREIEINLLTGEVKSTGTNVRVTLPGGGTLQIGAGIQISDASGHLEFDAGRLDTPPTPELCAALAG
jgi:hypothetical protein